MGPWWHSGRSRVSAIAEQPPPEWVGDRVQWGLAKLKQGVRGRSLLPRNLNHRVGQPDLGGIPAGRLENSEDVDQALQFLARDKPAQVTGSHLAVSVGSNLR